MAMQPPGRSNEFAVVWDIMDIGTLSHLMADPYTLDTRLLHDVCADIFARAETVDEFATLPFDDIASLSQAGLIEAVTQGEGARSFVGDPGRLGQVLQTIGAASLTVGRLYEGHVNAARLIRHYGSADAQSILVAEVSHGRLLGVWNAERLGGPLLTPVIGGWRLSGRKVHCSGAGHIQRPIVTARDPDGAGVMVLPI